VGLLLHELPAELAVLLAFPEEANNEIFLRVFAPLHIGQTGT
jgi:hypothetical protein